MIVEYCEQGTREWVEARLGTPTASNLSRIITPTGKLSGSRGEYMAELLAEVFEGEPYDDFKGQWLERGQVLEPDALRTYTLLREVEVEKVGIIFSDETYSFGASPDGLVGEEGGLELKCPASPQHLKYLALNDIPKAYVPQVQGALWASQRAWWDFMSYHPDYPELLVRVYPDDAYQKALSEHVPAFVHELRESMKRLIGMGLEPKVRQWCLAAPTTPPCR